MRCELTVAKHYVLAGSIADVLQHDMEGFVAAVLSGPLLGPNTAGLLSVGHKGHGLRGCISDRLRRRRRVSWGGGLVGRRRVREEEG